MRWYICARQHDMVRVCGGPALVLLVLVSSIMSHQLCMFEMKTTFNGGFMIRNQPKSRMMSHQVILNHRRHSKERIARSTASSTAGRRSRTCLIVAGQHYLIWRCSESGLKWFVILYVYAVCLFLIVAFRNSDLRLRCCCLT